MYYYTSNVRTTILTSNHTLWMHPSSLPSITRVFTFPPYYPGIYVTRIPTVGAHPSSPNMTTFDTFESQRIHKTTALFKIPCDAYAVCTTTRTCAYARGVRA